MHSGGGCNPHLMLLASVKSKQEVTCYLTLSWQMNVTAFFCLPLSSLITCKYPIRCHHRGGQNAKRHSHKRCDQKQPSVWNKPLCTTCCQCWWCLKAKALLVLHVYTDGRFEREIQTLSTFFIPHTGQSLYRVGVLVRQFWKLTDATLFRVSRTAWRAEVIPTGHHGEMK